MVDVRTGRGDEQRLTALNGYRVLDTAPEDVFEELVDLAATVCDTPMAAITLVDDQRQWFKAQRGLGCSETAREDSFCVHAIASPTRVMVVPDAHLDPRFARSGLVVGPPFIRFYAGVPLTTAEGLGLGSLCVLDHEPRTLREEQMKALQAVARQVLLQLELRRSRLLVEAATGMAGVAVPPSSGLALVSVGGIVAEANPGLCTMLGRAAEDLVGVPLAAVTHPEDVTLVEGVLALLLDGSSTTAVRELRLQLGDGRSRWMRWTATLVRDRDGEARHLLCHIEDVHELRGIEQLLSTATQTGSAVVTVDATGQVVSWSPGAQDLFGLCAADAVGSDLEVLLPDSGPSLRSLAAGSSASRQDALVVRRPDGSEVAAAMAGTAWRECGQPLVTLVLRPLQGLRIDEHAGPSADVPDRDRVDRSAPEAPGLRLREEGVDPLTGLPDRTTVIRRLAELLDAGPPPGTTVLCCDLDGLGLVNDALGMHAGDEVLREAARRLRGVAPQGQLVGRLGGDELVVVATGLVAPGDAEALGCRVMGRLAAPYRPAGQEVVLGCSVGVAVSDGEPTDAGRLVTDALIAMRVGKRSGRPERARPRAQQDAGAAERLWVEAGVPRALERGELRVLYQPTVDLRSGRLVGAEALLRWQHPQRGLLLPGAFLPVLEDSPLMPRIGAWVLRHACEELASWREEVGAGMEGFRLHVNVSVRELSEPDFADRVAAVLQRTGFPVGSLTLEITETLLARDPERMLEVLLHLRALGVGLAIDDFGTGYSSLHYLQRFPAGILKIDKAFIDAVAVAEPGRPHVAGAVIDLGLSMGLEVVAEGVETAEQAAWLRERGCTSAQGYHFARPLPVEELRRRLDAQGPSDADAADLAPITAGLEAADLVSHVLKALTELLGFGCAFVSRIEGSDYHVVGADDPAAIGMAAGARLPLDETFCGRALGGLAPPETHDLAASAHADLAVVEALGVRSYAMAPLAGPDGEILGTLCMLDRDTRVLPAHARAILRLFASVLARERVLARVHDERDRVRRDLMRREQEDRLRLATQLRDGPLERLEAVAMLLRSTGDGAGDPRLLAALGTLEEARLELRSLARGVQPAVSATPDAVARGLRTAALEVDREARVVIHLPEEPDADEVLLLGQLHRIARDLLADVVEHAEGRLRHLALVLRNRRALVRVVDAAPGGAVEDRPGLTAAAELARLLHGAVTVRSGRAGTSVAARLRA